MSRTLEEDEAIVAQLLRYQGAKDAYKVAKKMSEADLKRIAKEGFLSDTENGMMLAAVRVAEDALDRIRAVIERK